MHANYFAAKACLAHLADLEQNLGVIGGEIIVLGDTLDAGPLPCETLDLLQSKTSHFLLGNHEDYVFEHILHPKNQRYLDPLWKMVPWAARKLGKERCLKFKKECVFSMSFLNGKMHFLHASTQSNASAPLFFPEQQGKVSELSKGFEGAVKSVTFFGHTHYAGLHWNPGAPLRTDLWVNCGSVGYPFLAPKLQPESDLAEKFAVAVYTTVMAELSERNELHLKVSFHEVPYLRKDYVAAAIATGFWQECLPFSDAIVAQAMFNSDITFPFFRRAKRQGWPQHTLALRLQEYLDKEGWSAKLHQLAQLQ